jgi:hypothetical protein
LYSSFPFMTLRLRETGLNKRVDGRTFGVPIQRYLH